MTYPNNQSTTGAIPITGTVTVANQGSVGSNVTVTNFPGTQTVNGTVTVANPGSVSSNVSVTNFPTIQQIAGTLSGISSGITLASGNNTIGSTVLPVGTGALPSGSTTIAAVNTYQTLFSGNSIINGAYIQNPSTNTVPLYVDWIGAVGTTLQSTSQQLMPGSSVNAAFRPTNAVTVFATTTISFIAGRF